MNEPDRQEFIKAMPKEVLEQMNNGNFSLIKRVEVPEDKTILRAVWQMFNVQGSLPIPKYNMAKPFDG
jgi:hypothetical protein